MIKQFGDVGGLYAPFMRCPGLVPIPFAGAARKDLGISEFAYALNLDAPPKQSPRCVAIVARVP